MRILIEKADWIVTVDASRRLLRAGSILIENDRIAFVGSAGDLPSSIDVDRRIDGRGLLIAPGFVRQPMSTIRNSSAGDWPTNAISQAVAGAAVRI